MDASVIHSVVWQRLWWGPQTGKKQPEREGPQPLEMSGASDLRKIPTDDARPTVDASQPLWPLPTQQAMQDTRRMPTR